MRIHGLSDFYGNIAVAAGRYSRYVLSWRLSNTLDAGFCV